MLLVDKKKGNKTMCQNNCKNLSMSSGSNEADCYVFINLSNGIEAIHDFDLHLSNVRFLRIQSTACEQKRWEHILLDLSPDFLLLSSLGKIVVVYDFGAKKDVSRAIWQGLEWIKYVFSRSWLKKEYSLTGRAKSMGNYFYNEYRFLSKNTKSMLDYYGKYSVGLIDIKGISLPTCHDGDVLYYRDILLQEVT